MILLLKIHFKYPESSKKKMGSKGSKIEKNRFLGLT